MRNNKEKYSQLAEGTPIIPSGMAVVSADKIDFEVDLIKKKLSENKSFKLKTLVPITDFGIGEMAYHAEIEYYSNTYYIDIYLDKVENLHLEEYRFGNNIDNESVELATKQIYFIGTSMYFSEKTLESYHVQLKVMYTLVSNPLLCIDFMSFNILSGKWLIMTAKSDIPPSPDYLYIVHGVYDDKDDKSRYWLHTHGLHRCGMVELEMVNITQHPEEMNTMLNMVVKKFLTNPAKEQERFMIGYDGMGIDLCWLRWEKALIDFSENALGGFNDRKDDEDIHTEPAGVLYAVQEEGNMFSPEIYGKTLTENPIYYISNEETFRMSCLAKERFTFFTDLFGKHVPKKESKSFFGKIFGSKKENSSSWRFLVKLGLNVDDDNSGTDKEHLWYDVISIDGNRITGELLNQPYWISNLNEGDIKTYPIDLLTDWVIYAPDKSYNSDTIYELGYT